jgi:hypothetical protein
VANATTRDAKAGWDIYLSAGGGATLQDINSLLTAAGYHPIHDRTFRHYGNLLRAGYDRYVSINRFDVSRASDPYERTASSSRYSFRTFEVGVSVVFAKANRLIEASGLAEEIGDVGAILRFPDSTTSDALREVRPATGISIAVRFWDVRRTVTGRIIDSDFVSAVVSIEIEYGQLVSMASLAPQAMETLPPETARFALVADDVDDETVDVIGRRIFAFFELLEGVRSLVNAAGAVQHQPSYADPPVLGALTFSSPVTADILMAGQALNLINEVGISSILAAAGAYVLARKAWYEGSLSKAQKNALKHPVLPPLEVTTPESKKTKKEEEKTKREREKTKQAIEARKQAEEKIDQQELEVRIQLERLEVLRLKREVQAAESEVAVNVIAAVRESFPNSNISDEDIVSYVRNHIEPPVNTLAETGVTRIERLRRRNRR